MQSLQEQPDRGANVANLKQKVVVAIKMLMNQEPELLKMDANERSISHRLARYLEDGFPGYHVDCEYNRSGYTSDTKLLDYLMDETVLPPKGDPRGDEHAHTVFPDIIVHLRVKDVNIVVIEIKKTTSREDYTKDQNKLKAFTNPQSMRDDERGRVYNYHVGLFLELKTGDGVENPAKLVAKGIWFVNGVAESDTLQFLCDADYKRPASVG